MSVSARHEAVLENGCRVLLLDDRGLERLGPARHLGSDIDRGHRGHGAHGGRTGRAIRWAEFLELKRLPHDVVPSEQLLGRVGHDPGDAA